MQLGIIWACYEGNIHCQNGKNALHLSADFMHLCHMAKSSSAASKTFIPVKLCYSHIGGQLGSLLSEHFVAKKWIEPVEGNERQYAVTTRGKKGFADLGIDLSLITPQELA
jgi:hypothetical protein